MTVRNMEQVLDWFANGERGLSSEAMALYLTHRKMPRSAWHYPSDPDDLQRCVKLLHAVPWMREVLHELRELGPVWSAYVHHWHELEATLIEESGGDIHTEKHYAAPKTYKLMTRLQKEAMELP